ncbi:MAG: Fe-S cluster assembly sulfur transfer protein SufU [Ilumatobacteraceae bacterium]
MPGLDDLYREIILDHHRNPRNRGTLETPPARVAVGHNPLCGDEIEVYLQVENGVVADVRIGGSGCSISQSSASMMSQAVKGRPIAEVEALVRRFKAMMSIPDDDGNPIEADPSVTLGDLEALQGVVKFPVRIKCATLAWNTLLDALAAG